MSVYQKCIPTEYVSSIFEIQYENLKKQGIKSLFFDLDNTIIAYDEQQLSEQHVSFFNALRKDFNILIMSNSGYNRVSKAMVNLDLPYIWHAKKPLGFGFKKGLKMLNAKKSETLIIGDQLMTDVFGATRFGIKSILVASVKRKSDRKITKFNRKLENHFLKKIEKKLPDLYQERLKTYVDNQ
jgi:HAD superfamily phosphatase (TIGR01668 family)